MRVYIYQRVLPHYRVPFFERLYQLCKGCGIELTVLYGLEKQGAVPRSVHPQRPWAVLIKNVYINLYFTEVCFQVPVKQSLTRNSVVIVEQASRLLMNYILFVLRGVRWLKIGFWGHGRNFQNDEGRLVEVFKRAYSTNCDWWFCYTEGSAKIVNELGFPQSRITVVRNSIDTESLLSARNSLSQSRIDELRQTLNIDGSNVAVFCGGMYSHKRIDFLLAACIEARKRLTDFEIVFIGDGPDAYKVEEFCKTHSWGRFLGQISGVERASYFALAKVFLMPGLVGLAVLDSFALATPMITTDNSFHSPEIEYLIDGENGLVVANVLEDYVSAVVRAMTDDDLLTKLQAGCAQSAKLYTIDNMALNYAQGLRSFVSGTH